MQENIKQHLKIYSYKECTLKWADYDYWGPNELSMKNHYGRYHAEKCECGLCDL